MQENGKPLLLWINTRQKGKKEWGLHVHFNCLLFVNHKTINGDAYVANPILSSITENLILF